MKLQTQNLFSLVAIALLACSEMGFSNDNDNVVIVLDDSGSMNERMNSGEKRIDAAKKAIKEVLKQFPPATKLGLMLLNGDRSNQHWAIPLEHLSVPQATRRVETVRADGGTPLGERMRDGAEALLRMREKQIYGTYRLLIVTDGEANDKQLLELYLPDVLSRGLVVDAIGVDMKKNHSLATRVHSYRRADDGEALSKAIQEVFAEKIDSNAADNKTDFELLQAIDDVTAKEALSLLSRPNNSPIVGISPVDSFQESNRLPAQNNPASGGSVLGSLLAAVFGCLLPLAVIVLILFSVLSKSQSRSNQKRGSR